MQASADITRTGSLTCTATAAFSSPGVTLFAGPGDEAAADAAASFAHGGGMPGFHSVLLHADLFESGEVTAAGIAAEVRLRLPRGGSVFLGSCNAGRYGRFSRAADLLLALGAGYRVLASRDAVRTGHAGQTAADGFVMLSLREEGSPGSRDQIGETELPGSRFEHDDPDSGTVWRRGYGSNRGSSGRSNPPPPPPPAPMTFQQRVDNIEAEYQARAGRGDPQADQIWAAQRARLRRDMLRSLSQPVTTPFGRFDVVAAGLTPHRSDDERLLVEQFFPHAQVNVDGGTPEAEYNCSFASAAVAQRAEGNYLPSTIPQDAAQPVYTDWLTVQFGREFNRFTRPADGTEIAGFGGVIGEAGTQGEGFHGIVEFHAAVETPGRHRGETVHGRLDHAINVENADGFVVFLDGQAGALADLPSYTAPHGTTVTMEQTHLLVTRDGPNPEGVGRVDQPAPENPYAQGALPPVGGPARDVISPTGTPEQRNPTPPVRPTSSQKTAGRAR